MVKKMDEKRVRQLFLERLGIIKKLAQIGKKKKIIEQGLPTD